MTLKIVPKDFDSKIFELFLNTDDIATIYERLRIILKHEKNAPQFMTRTFQAIQTMSSGFELINSKTGIASWVAEGPDYKIKLTLTHLEAQSLMQFVCNYANATKCLIDNHPQDAGKNERRDYELFHGYFTDLNAQLERQEFFPKEFTN